ncbi:MAG: prephenate dehydratase [Eubacteriales bacterium]
MGGKLDLLQIRDEIDAIDQELVACYEKRMKLVHDVANYKIETGKAIFDKEREEQKIATVKGLVENDFNAFAIEQLFEQIMAMSRKLQHQLLEEKGKLPKEQFDVLPPINKESVKVIFQGAIGAYSEVAMKKYFGEEVTCYCVDTFSQAMEEIKEGKAEFAVLPIENSSAGPVSEVYDLLVEYDNYIVAEQVIQIEHYLLGVEGSRIEDIKTVYSHPQSLMQSGKFLGKHHEWQQISMKNNAFATQKVANENDKTQAAIASKAAGECYGLIPLQARVNDNPNNETRFIVICNSRCYLKGADKISICFEIPHTSGSLYRVLSHFIYNHLNMTKIESRPIGYKNWEYRFFVDFEGNLEDSAVQNALTSIRGEVNQLKVLGNYE